MSRRKSHGMTGTKIYGVWYQARFRKLLCDEWKDDFEAFHAWAIANGYKEGLCLNRIDHDKPFSPENCAWRKWRIEFGCYHCRYLTYNGETHNVTEWAKKLGIKRVTIYRRLFNGWSDEKTLSTPVVSRKRNEKKEK